MPASVVAIPYDKTSVCRQIWKTTVIDTHARLLLVPPTEVTGTVIDLLKAAGMPLGARVPAAAAGVSHAALLISETSAVRRIVFKSLALLL